ncbi:ATP synthase F1 subunit delta [Flavobacteriaceae bacterium XHP0103]|uniref:ATP synthase F1 subunit delta n=1 Tax=Marixanthotalea marina TaxID=2844359 RepID=UPI002989A4D0|nr:ATP synthase F1 subunit delta [Marixanthotalea marina]MBU3820685.1 ATP synthase F1 subunit delta [Marixanthotalea marina]
MAGARAAIRYAKATLSLASELNSSERINDDMKLIVNTVSDSKDLSNMLKSPIINASMKKAVLLEAFKDTNKTTLDLINVLVSNNRIDILEDVAKKYTQLFDESKGVELATVTTAVALTADLKKKVLAKAKELTGKDIEVENIVDESIIGGFILRVGDVQYNASISNQLNKLKREFSIN